jgi:hypothetical protein
MTPIENTATTQTTLKPRTCDIVFGPFRRVSAHDSDFLRSTPTERRATGHPLEVPPSRALKIAVLVITFGRFERSAQAREMSPCGSAAVIEGDARVQAAVIDELQRRGISTTAASGCPFVTARIGQEGAGLDMTIVDTYGRTSKRTANGPAAAATLIESWVRSDLSAPLLPVLDSVETVSHPVESKPMLVTRDTGSEVRTRSNISLTASAETSLATDGSVWLGLATGVCVRIGPACVGALARVESDSGAYGESREMYTSRFGTAVLLGVGLPMRRGRLTFLPGVAVGVGWLRTTALSTGDNGPGGDSTEVDSGGLRASAGLRLSIAMRPSLAVDLGLAADFAPVAHTTPYNLDSVILAGEPRGFLRGSLGVRLGAL